MFFSSMKKYDYIFVDYFDTIAFRTVHSHQMYTQWAKVLSAKVPEIERKRFTLERLISIRHSASSDLYKLYEEPSYELLVKDIYHKIFNDASLIEFEDFYSICYNVDLSIELGCQYPNEEIVALLKKCKGEGKKIYIVSDFYLPKSVYSDFLVHIGCDDLIDDVFVSSEIGKSKKKGALYQYVLDSLGADPAACCMIGDQKRDDVQNAEKNGIKGFRYFPLKHKLWTNISKRLKFHFSNRAIVFWGNWLYRKSLYEEYVLPLYYFIRELSKNAKQFDASRLAFLSRGGAFLKQIFDEFQNLIIPQEQTIQSLYCYNSRKVCVRAHEAFAKGGGQDLENLVVYLINFLDKDRLFIVDEGWYNHSQQQIAEVTGWETYGFYIGSRSKNKISFEDKCIRKGLLFDKAKDGSESKYYGIFCANCALYEQILTARHGSVDEYVNKNGEIVPAFKENENELYLYDTYVRKMQKKMLLTFKGLCAWSFDVELSTKNLARIMLKTAIFGNSRRMRFLNEFDKNRFDNFSTGKTKDKGVKDVKIRIGELLLHPDRYVGMFCKLQRKIYDKPLLNVLYYPVALGFYLYVRILCRL